jgi:hypothetical protein
MMKFHNCLWFRQLSVKTSFISFEQQIALYWECCEFTEQRSNQSDFSFELEELSTKFAGIKEPVKKG